MPYRCTLKAMSVYTGRGDEGETDLRDMTRVSKTDPRIEAYGSVDELNAFIGTVRPIGFADIDRQLREIQNHLHVVQAEFADPVPKSEPASESETESASGPTVRPEHVDTLEEWIDSLSEELEPLQRFILPGGSEGGSALHYARTICRRSERRAVALHEADPRETEAIRYLNRLSDHLFVAGRAVNAREEIPEEHPTY